MLSKLVMIFDMLIGRLEIFPTVDLICTACMETSLMKESRMVTG